MKNNILFIDHSYHKITRSSEFFVSLLRARFNVNHIYVDPGRPLPFDKNIIADIDRVVIWQMDYLAPIFLSLGVPTIVVPMYDGSAALSYKHWLFLSGAKFINFSFNLHTRITALGCESLLVKYFPESSENEFISDFSVFKCFFWQRRAEHGIHWKLLNHVIGEVLAELHIHDAPDDAKSYFPLPGADSLNYKVSSSTWFQDSREMQALMNRANIYFAPRLSEGIGMGFLEAMAKGMVVIAPNQPTHNEYIVNGVNGYLYDPNSPTSITLTPIDARNISKWAIDTIRQGRKNWEASFDQISDFISTAVACPNYTNIINIHLYSKYFSAYSAGLEVYERFLSDHSYIIESLNQHNSSLFLEPTTENSTIASKDTKLFIPHIPINTQLTFGTDGAAVRYMLSGWQNEEKNTSCIGVSGGILAFRINEVFKNEPARLSISISPTEYIKKFPIQIGLEINSHDIGIFFIDDKVTELLVDFDLAKVGGNLGSFYTLAIKPLALVSHTPDSLPCLTVHSLTILCE